LRIATLSVETVEAGVGSDEAAIRETVHGPVTAVNLSGIFEMPPVCESEELVYGLNVLDAGGASGDACASAAI
jgi:hypothetical protein